MKKIIKTIVFMLLVASATVNYSCQKETSNNYTLYNETDGYYYGDAFNNGSACFIIDIHENTNDSLGIRIESFTAMPSDVANFDITGAYSVYSTANANTCLKGYIDSTGLFGSYAYDLKAKKIILITGGYLDISSSKGKYTIKTNFTGKDTRTGDTIPSINYTFNGEIKFTDLSGSRWSPEYDTADGYYYGDIDTTGTANFIVDMYNDVDNQVGLWIQGYAPLPSSVNDFKATGSYSVASSGAEFTCLRGYTFLDDPNLYGTYVYDFDTQKFILVTGGTFDVSLSDDNKYVIATDFTGKDLNTGAPYTDLRYNFTGKINFSDEMKSSSSGSLMRSSVFKSATPNFIRNPFSRFHKQLMK